MFGLLRGLLRGKFSARQHKGTLTPKRLPHAWIKGRGVRAIGRHTKKGIFLSIFFFDLSLSLYLSSHSFSFSHFSLSLCVTLFTSRFSRFFRLLVASALRLTLSFSCIFLLISQYDHSQCSIIGGYIKLWEKIPIYVIPDLTNFPVCGFYITTRVE